MNDFGDLFANEPQRRHFAEYLTGLFVAARNAVIGINYKLAHDYLISNYVCTWGKHHPLDFRCFQKQEPCQAREAPFKDHTELFKELVDWVGEKKIPGTFAMDSYFTNAPILNYIHGKQLGDGQPRGYVGLLKFNRKLLYQGRTIKASELAAEIAPEPRKLLERLKLPQFTATSAADRALGR